MSETLNGAITLYVVAKDFAMAEALAHQAGRPVEIKVTPNAFPGRIYGFDSARAFLPCLRIDIQDSDQ